ncbi:MAG: lipopolysaccharide heptosyltransferase II [Endomicrobium sp.]|uniref:lipopolysaccharide heptosyltransferase II n=1 Tax=Candidatus Endomicrobiellum pyrsonymphae TaxID=1408203 RepID=UPI00358AFF02|nr:lipopolysaccharide heptosyltransferase II [Endomicrobium sp.]
MRKESFIKVVTFICHIIDKTLRKKSLNETLHYHKPSIYSFWHGNEFPMLMSNQKNNIVIMVSLSDDGEMLSQILKSFGYITVRGSSGKGGERALIKIIRYARQGRTLAFAADGPRGPYHKLKSGVVYTAQKTGMPLLPINCSPKNKIVLNKSWDKTIIPLPFSKTVQIYGEPIYVNDGDNIEEKTTLVEERLNKLSEFTDKYYWRKDILKYLEYHPSPKILIVQPSRIGDIIFALPVLSAIKKKYPHAKLSWIVDERCSEILEDNPLLENIFIWDRKQVSLKYYRNLKKQLRNDKFDLSIDLHGLAKSAMLVQLAAARFKLASSSTNGMREFSWLFSKEIKASQERHCVERHFEVAKYLGCTYEVNYSISIPEECFKSVREKLLKENVNLDKVIGIHPGGGWISRRWDSYKFAVLAGKLKTELGADVVLVGGKEGGTSEKDLNKEIIVDAGIKMVDMTGKFTLKELCAFLKMCKVFVGNEAGPMHIATALNTQTVAILGPTDAKRTGPYGGSTKIIQHQVDCQPCRNRNCKDVICMKDITVTEVFSEIKRKLYIVKSL